MKLVALSLLLMISSTSFAEIIKRENKSKSCTEYLILNKEYVAGKAVLPRALNENETVFSTKDLYGYKIQDLNINFDEGFISFAIIKQVILGLNGTLLQERVKIAADSPLLKEVINKVNRKIGTYKSLCITADNMLISAER